MGRSDAELLEASRRGEREAFGALIERYQGVVSAVSYSRTGDHALSEDVAQDTFIAAWRQLGQLREPGRLKSWLCGIARNLARKARRRSAREAPLDHPLVFEGANPFDQLWDEYPKMLRVVVKQLPVHAAAVLPAEAALAADAQGKFWELHDLMLAHQDSLTHDGLIGLAERAGLDAAAFRSALDRHAYGAAVDADKATANFGASRSPKPVHRDHRNRAMAIGGSTNRECRSRADPGADQRVEAGLTPW